MCCLEAAIPHLNVPGSEVHRQLVGLWYDKKVLDYLRHAAPDKRGDLARQDWYPLQEGDLE
jgi:hypothetical protein